MRPLWRLALAALVAACGPADRGEDGALAQWTVSAAPVLDITDDDAAAGEPLLGDVVGVTQLPDGGVLVADRGLFALRWFDATGSLTRSLGREGQGPGEWTYIARMLRCGDSVFVFDIGRGTGSLLPVSVDGEQGTMFVTSGPESAPPYRTVCNAEGRYLSYGWERWATVQDEGRTGRWRGQVPFWINDRSGAVAATLGEWPGSERLLVPGGSSPHPLGKETVIGLSRRWAYIGTADSGLVQRVAPDGTPAEPLRLPAEDLRTTPEDIAAWKLRDTLGQSAEDVAMQVQRFFGVEFPPTVPAYDALLVDAADRVYVRRTPRGASPWATWVVFSAEGSAAAQLRLPADLVVYEFGPGYALGVLLDPVTGVQRVQRYAITAGSGRTP